MVLTCALLGMSLSACTDELDSNETSVPEETSVVSAEITKPIDYGTLTIDDVFAWVGYPENFVIPTFSIPELAEELLLFWGVTRSVPYTPGEGIQPGYQGWRNMITVNRP